VIVRSFDVTRSKFRVGAVDRFPLDRYEQSLHSLKPRPFAPQHITKLAEGDQYLAVETLWMPSASFVMTIATFTLEASHEGIKLSSERNEQIPEYMRKADGWYEEDEQWAIVAVVYPDAFLKWNGRRRVCDAEELAFGRL
jgi:hypothetical protein